MEFKLENSERSKEDSYFNKEYSQTNNAKLYEKIQKIIIRDESNPSIIS